MLKKLKSLFIVEDENGDKKEPSSNKPVQTSPDPDLENVPVDTVVDLDLDSPKELAGKPDPKFLDILLKAIEKNNLEGFDYLEYKQSLQSLNSMGMDEATKFKSAFAMAKTMGATKTKLINSGNHYIKILKTEETKFKDALVNQRKKQIKGREDSIINLEKTIQQKEAEIQKLKKDIEAHNTKLDSIRKEINKSAAKVESTNDKFHLAYNVVMGQIGADLEKMKNYLT